MITTKPKYSPSVNIIRDADASFQYIPTTNGQLVFKQITESYLAGGKHSFSIVGSYGTGKSTFLWALQNTMTGKHPYLHASDPATGPVSGLPLFDFLPIVGEHDSFIEVMARELGEKPGSSPRKLLEKVERLYQQKKASGKGLVIIVDEFGKFLEHTAKHNPEKELYFIQQLAEWANDADKDVLFIVTLHQGFDAYATTLDKAQRQEWDKVKGRLKELVFNEPVEQLLALAAERLAGNDAKAPTHFDELFDAIDQAKVFPLQSYFDKQTAKKLLPFDILSAAVLTLALQSYGQNERSLFSFIEGDEYLSIGDFDEAKNPFYNISCVYDYLVYHYHTGIVSKYNPHYTQWAAIRNALERLDGIYTDLDELKKAQKVIKTIGLLNIFAPASAKLDGTFLQAYGVYSLGIEAKETEYLLRDLDKIYKVIIFRTHLNKYRFRGDSNLDIELAINKAGELITHVPNFINRLNENFNFPHILAKSHFFKTGAPRFYRFRLTAEAIDPEAPEGEIDGFINLVFADPDSSVSVQSFSQSCQEAIVYGWYKDVEGVQKTLLEIEKVKKVIDEHKDDKVAVRELKSIHEHYKNILTSQVLGKMYADDGTVEWYFEGKRLVVNSQKDFNRHLSEICDQVYEAAPSVQFEMINKTRLSAAMSTARKKLMDNLISNYSRKDLGFEEERFPPEKSIYLVLLKQTGIHQADRHGALLSAPTDPSLLPLWQAGEAFLQASKAGKRKVSELLEILSKRPFKIKQGLLDVWLPVYLFIKRDEFALFGENGYIPNLSYDELDLLVKEPERYELKAFDVEGVKLDLFNSYRQMLDQTMELQFSNALFVDTIKPFLVFYKQLPEYAKRTRRLSKEAIKLREAVANAKDPEKSFFEDFPNALGYNALSLQKNSHELASYIPTLQQAIKEIRTSFDGLLRRFEKCLLDRISGNDNLEFPSYKEQLQERYKKIKKHLLLPYQKVFLLRVDSAIQDRQAWLLSIAEACLNKRLEHISDEEEPLLMSKLQNIIQELDQLNQMSVKEVDEQKEMAFELQISTLVEGFKKNKQFVRLPKSKKAEIEKVEEAIKSQLLTDRELNIAILAKLLQEQMENGES